LGLQPWSGLRLRSRRAWFRSRFALHVIIFWIFIFLNFKHFILFLWDLLHSLTFSRSSGASLKITANSSVSSNPTSHKTDQSNLQVCVEENTDWLCGETTMIFVGDLANEPFDRAALSTTKPWRRLSSAWRSEMASATLVMALWVSCGEAWCWCASPWHKL
jgi:hypothetical protein